MVFRNPFHIRLNDHKIKWLNFLYFCVGTASVTCRRLRVQCGPGERLIQRSAYDQPYFHTSSVDLLSTSIQNSPIYCMWKNNFTEKVNSNEYKTKKKWYKNNMQCLKEGIIFSSIYCVIYRVLDLIDKW